MHVARNTDRLSEWQADIRTVRTGRETDDHEQCGQAERQTITNSADRQRDRRSRTVRTGRETDDHEQCGQADEQGGQVEIEIDEQCGQAER